jgi:CRP-like cAMP-binding protein
MSDPWGWNGESLILRSLSKGIRDEIESEATLVSFQRGEPVFDAQHPFKTVLLPTSGMISLVTTMRDGSKIETHTVGREGIVGGPFVRLRQALLPNLEAFCQMPGDGLGVPIDDFASLMERNAELSDLVDRYTQCVIGQMGQSAACNRLHPLEERLAKWLLHAHDRSGTDELPLTHEFLAEMLGVRRETVTIAVARFEEKGIVGHRRGHLSIEDRGALQAAACECYAIVRGEIDSIVPSR